MLDYNFLRPPCMLAPYPKGFFIGTWEDYRGGVPLAEPTYLSFICDGWSIKSRPGTFSPHRSPKKPIMGVGSGGERARKPPPLFHQLSLRQKNAPDPKKLRMQCERAEKRATAWFTTISTQANKNLSSNLESSGWQSRDSEKNHSSKKWWKIPSLGTLCRLQNLKMITSLKFCLQSRPKTKLRAEPDPFPIAERWEMLKLVGRAENWSEMSPNPTCASTMWHNVQFTMYTIPKHNAQIPTMRPHPCINHQPRDIALTWCRISHQDNLQAVLWYYIQKINQS